MPDEDKTFSDSFVLDLRIWWRQVHTLYLRIGNFKHHSISRDTYLCDPYMGVSPRELGQMLHSFGTS